MWPPCVAGVVVLPVDVGVVSARVRPHHVPPAATSRVRAHKSESRSTAPPGYRLSGGCRPHPGPRAELQAHRLLRIHVPGTSFQPDERGPAGAEEGLPCPISHGLTPTTNSATSPRAPACATSS